MFGEHGEWVHRNSLYEEVLRVPLFLHYPGALPANKVIDAPVFTADLMPTILNLAGLPIPAGLDGANLVPLIQGLDEDLTHRPIYAEMEGEPLPSSLGYWIAPRNDLRSVKEDGWKYIFERNNPGGNALYEVQDVSVYEETNLIVDYPQKAEGYQEKLYDWFQLPTYFNFVPSASYP
jgi:arylsulfatase A-like enzyme